MDKRKPSGSDSQQSTLKHNPFNRLKGLVERWDRPPSRLSRAVSRRRKEPDRDPRGDERLFREAMAGVTPIDRGHVVRRPGGIRPVERPRCLPEDEAVHRLARLVTRGEGFVVSDTPEYIEGTGYNVRREFARRLHRGDYSIQDHIDLHGFTVEYAKEAFEEFLNASVNSGKRAVLVIHGRGLSSPGEAVLKNKVREWLNHGYWLKRVIAYASAQLYDGGAGATYILLRDRPVSKRSGSRGQAARRP